MDYTITDINSVHHLQLHVDKNTLTKIEVEIPNVDKNVQQEFSLKLTRFSHACGCESGAIFCGITLVLLIVFGISSHRPLSELLHDYAFVGLIMLVGASTLGKYIGLAYARIRFEQTLRHIANIVE